MEDKNLYNNIKKDFYYRYTKFVVPIIADYEGERKINLFFALLFLTVLAITGIIIFLNNNGYLNFSIVIICLGYIVYRKIKKDFERKLKQRVMPIVCRCFPDLKWSSISFSASDIYKICNLINDFNKINYDDCFYGSYDNVNFKIEECHAIRETRTSRRRKSQQTIFKGVIITVDMNKNFKGNTVIRPDSFLNNVFTPSFNLHKTKLEDVEFEKKFDVFTDDDVEARYLLTPSFMERLNKIRMSFNADKVSASFYEGKLYIGLHTNKDLFQLGSLTKNVCDKKQFFTMFEEILSIVMLIDYFKLNQNIGL